MSVYTKQNVEFNEYYIHYLVYKLGIVNVPKIYSYNASTKELKMEKINEMNISDMYGDELSSVPRILISKIRKIIRLLDDNMIDYPDITGYNFIEYKDKMWIIDFGHAKLRSNDVPTTKFIDDFTGEIGNWDEISWNPEYK